VDKMSHIEDYMWFELNREKINKENIEHRVYVIISNQKIVGFENDYNMALKKYGTEVAIFHI